MSNPSLPPQPDARWPLQALDEIARTAAIVLDASRVWIALRDRHNTLIPRIAIAAKGEQTSAIDPNDAPDLIKDAIRQITTSSVSFTPLTISDVRARPDLARLAGPEAKAIRTLVAIELVNEDSIIGALLVTFAHVVALTSQRSLLLQSFARQAVTTIRLNTAADRTASQAREMGALLRASHALTSTLEANSVFRAIIQSIQEVIFCESALIFHHDERTEHLRVITGMGNGTEELEGSLISLADPDSKAALVARTQRPFVNQVGPHDEIGVLTDVLRAGQTVALLCIPLISKGRLRGVASLARQQPFTPGELSMMGRLSPIAAAALENVELFQREQAARQQQETIFASASDGFALVDESLRFLLVNDAFARYVAADPTELVGKLSCLAFGATLEPVPSTAGCRICAVSGHCLMREALERRTEKQHVECLFPPPVSSSLANASIGPESVGRVIDFSLTPMHRPDGRERLLVVGRDVTGPRELERVRNEYIHMTSHEISAPLQTITGYIELFLKEYGLRLDAEYIGMLQTALASAYSMKAVADDLEVLSKRDAGIWEINPEPLDLSVEALAAVAEMRLLARDNSVILQMEPPPPHLPLALMDPVRARQVARNLISNAIKFTPPGGWVRVAVTADMEYVQLRVQDTGIGIPEEALEMIWKRYYRVPLSREGEHVAGQGLGLAIVRIITDKHNGLRDVKSAVGKGSVFTISIPRADRPALTQR